MTNAAFIESGMTFGPYSAGHCFYIEKSQTYQSIQDGVQMAEFLLLRQNDARPPSIWIVEAKSSSPRSETQPNFDQFIEEIRAKLTNALSVGLALCIGRHPASVSEPSTEFKTLDLSKLGFCLVLIINGHQDAWLPPLQEALSKALKSTVKTWALSPTSVIVINDALAREYGLIQ